MNFDTSFGWFFFGCLDGLLRLWDQNLLQWFPLLCFFNSMHLVAWFFQIHTRAGLVSFRLMVQKSDVHQLRLLVYPCLSQYFQGFIHPKGGFLARDFWTINSIKSHFCLWNTQKCFQCKPANLFEDWWKPEILLSFQLPRWGHPVFFRQPLPWSPNPPPKKIIGIPTTFWGHLRWIIMQILMVFHKSHCQRWVTKSTKNPKVFHSEFSLPLKNGWERKEGRLIRLPFFRFRGTFSRGFCCVKLREGKQLLFMFFAGREVWRSSEVLDFQGWLILEKFSTMFVKCMKCCNVSFWEQLHNTTIWYDMIWYSSIIDTIQSDVYAVYILYIFKGKYSLSHIV